MAFLASKNKKEKEFAKVSKVVKDAEQGEFRRLEVKPTSHSFLSQHQHCLPQHPGKIFHLRSRNAGKRSFGERALGQPREVFEDLQVNSFKMNYLISDCLLCQESDHFSERIILLDTMVSCFPSIITE